MAVIHGGRLDAAIARYGGTQKSWLDLSTGINPNPYPVPHIGDITWSQLPQESDLDAVNAAARNTFGATSDVPSIASAGEQAIIQALPVLFKPQSVAIVGFTYQEHGLCWRRSGHQVLVADGLDSAAASARIVVVVNPNNPDGRMHDPSALVDLAKRLGSKGGLLVVDEAYCDGLPDQSVISSAGQPGLLILRSFGKLFGLAGLRLGFAFGPELLIERLKERLGPWPVSGPALAIGKCALEDRSWIKRNEKRMIANRSAFENILQKTGYSIIGGTNSFQTVQLEEAGELHEFLARQHILTRPFPGREDWLRFGIPGKKPALKRIKKALAEFRA